MEDSIIGRQFDSTKAKIGIIGDFGTGLADSIQLLKDLILNKGVNIILHLGDVYYAGTPHEYDQNVTKIMDQLRVKAKRQVLFYSIPGNHDYYSWGLPYLCFIKNINSDQFTKQTASYFCLRSQNKKWQFIGLDTAYHDSNPANQINSASLGPSIRSKQIKWFEDKMETFPGSTILLTHHQLFSIHQRLCGSFTSYRHFSCINPLLSAQLFKYTPHISAWFWGHQHSYMLFGDEVAGARKCRLLGNSSFHVFSKQNPYTRKQGFPIIPFVCSDQQYYNNYLPVDPKQQKTFNNVMTNTNKNSNNKQSQHYYNLCYAMIDFQRCSADNNQLPIQYYCCPCFSSSGTGVASTPSLKFKPYLIYQQHIYHRLAKQQLVAYGDSLQIKAEIGLFVQKGNKLTLGGSKFTINNQSQLKQQSMQQGQQNKKDYICDGDTITFMIDNTIVGIKQSQPQQKQINPNQNTNTNTDTAIKKQQQQSQKTQQQQIANTKSQSLSAFQSFLTNKQFTINKKIVMQDHSGFIKYGDAFSLQAKNQDNRYLCCEVGLLGPYIQIDSHQSLFMFIKDSNIVDAANPYQHAASDISK